MKNDLVEKLQEILVFLGFHPGPIDGRFGLFTETAVEGFQTASGLLHDGVVGPQTLQALEGVGQTLGFKFPSSVLVTPAKQTLLRWVKCPADKVNGYDGYTRTTLRSDVGKAYKSLYAAIHVRGGVVTSAGGKRSLSRKSTKSTSRTSFHYVGRAFDLALPTGMQDVHKDPYIVQHLGDRKWLVWCRTENTDFPEITLQASWVSSKKDKSGKRKTTLHQTEIKARAFCFTNLARQYGFHPIKGRSGFFRGGPYSGAEWWHFQYEKGLVTGVSTFGEELLKCYSLKDAKKFIYWDSSKHCVFGDSWN